MLHLVRCLVRERDRQDLERRHPVFADEVADPVREHAGLARSRTGDDQQRAAHVRHCLELRGVQAVE